MKDNSTNCILGIIFCSYMELKIIFFKIWVNLVIRVFVVVYSHKEGSFSHSYIYFTFELLNESHQALKLVVERTYLSYVKLKLKLLQIFLYSFCPVLSIFMVSKTYCHVHVLRVFVCVERVLVFACVDRKAEVKNIWRKSKM